MEGTKEADLITAVLMYAIRCLAEGDQAALRDMQFGIKEIEALRTLPPSAARDDLERATALDPEHARAFATLASVRTFLGVYGHLPHDSTFAFVREPALRALENTRL